MAIVVVGGGGRGAGKTALVCGIISKLPEFHWVAAKVTTHTHDILNEIWKEKNPGSGKDTARYLAAGARDSFLLSSAENVETDTSLFELWMARTQGANIIFESNRVLNFVQPDLYLVVAGGAEDKPSFKSAIQSADAIVGGPNSRALLRSHAKVTRPIFELENPHTLTPELADWICNRLIYR